RHPGDGFHINANPASFDYLIPTTLNVTDQTPLRVIYPQPVSFRPKFDDQVLDVYEGTVRITAEFPLAFRSGIPNSTSKPTAHLYQSRNLCQSSTGRDM